MTQRATCIMLGLLICFLSKPASGQNNQATDRDRGRTDQQNKSAVASGSSQPTKSSTTRTEGQPGDTKLVGKEVRITAQPGHQRGGESGSPTTVMIQEPSQGRPIFITPGETFYFVMQLPRDLSGVVNFDLRLALEPEIRVPLKPETPPSYNDQYCSLLLLVPQQTRPGLYDIEVRTSKGAFYTRRSVKVVDNYKSKFRFVHLSNMNVGDLTAPNFDEMLPREINLLAPEFIIATGDYTEWARARDDAKSWEKILKYFEQFTAPVFMLCGAHDHEASFTRYVAGKPVDKIDYGAYHGLLLLDHPGNPIDQDYSQVQWIENDLKRHRNKRFTFIASNSDELALLDIWRENGNLADFIRDHKIKLFITGGSADWDYKEFADKLKDAPGLHFVRTHQSSTAQRDRSTGFSHYRVFDVDGDEVAYTYPDDNSAEKLQHSVPSGRLRAYFDGPNEGLAARVSVTVQNALNQSFPNCRVWMRVAKGKTTEPPTVAPGKLLDAIDCGAYWACDVAFDLPDKGATRIMAAADANDIPPALPIDVELDGPREWSFMPRSTTFGLTYFACDESVRIKFTNRARVAVTCWPVFRVNGSQLTVDRKTFPRLPITLEPGKTLAVPLELDLRKVSPGRHSFQVYFLEDPLARLTTFDVTLQNAQ